MSRRASDRDVFFWLEPAPMASHMRADMGFEQRVVLLTPRGAPEGGGCLVVSRSFFRVSEGFVSESGESARLACLGIRGEGSTCMTV